MFSIDEDELDIDLDDEEFLLAACGITQSSNSSSSNSSSLTSKSKTNKSLQSRAGFNRKPFNPLENSASLSRENQRQGPDNHLDQHKPAGSGNFNNISTTCTNNNNGNIKKRYNSTTNHHQSTCIKEFEPHAKRFASNSTSGYQSFAQKYNLNFNATRTSNDSTNLQDTSCRNKDVANPKGRNLQSLHTKNAGSSPGIFSQSKRSIQHSCLNSRTHSPSHELRTPDIGSQEQKKSRTISERQMNGNDSDNVHTRACIDVTPSHKKFSRKFPGPAGLLPKLTIGQNLEELCMKVSPLPSTSQQSPVNHPPVSSQLPSEDEEFARGPWVGMLNEYQQNVPIMMRYSIVQVISEAACQRLQYGKVPSLCVLVKTFSPTETDSSIILKDPTGEIYGTLHKRVLEEYQTELGPGAGIILKQVSVFSPSPRKHYLNITPGNIIEIYPPDPSHVSSSQLLASQQTQADNAKRRTDPKKPEIILEALSKTPDNSQQGKEISLGNSENFDELLEGLGDDEILDEDLLAMY